MFIFISLCPPCFHRPIDLLYCRTRTRYSQPPRRRGAPLARRSRHASPRPRLLHSRRCVIRPRCARLHALRYFIASCFREYVCVYRNRMLQHCTLFQYAVSALAGQNLHFPVFPHSPLSTLTRMPPPLSSTLCSRSPYPSRLPLPLSTFARLPPPLSIHPLLTPTSLPRPPLPLPLPSPPSFRTRPPRGVCCSTISGWPPRSPRPPTRR
jgi:hypothetical protein